MRHGETDKAGQKDSLKKDDETMTDEKNSGMTYVENAHASGDGSFKRSDEDSLKRSTEKDKNSGSDY